MTEIEASEDVTVLLAVESGSRAWGFASKDSDFDVRFIYVRPRDWYLSIGTQRDVLEYPIDTHGLDISGWDLKKALQLFAKSNPPLLEWLQCPMIYKQEAGFAQELHSLLPHFYSRTSCYHHYAHMAAGNMREYLRGDIVWIKKYFYVLRPLLAMSWIRSRPGPVPIEFEKLVHASVVDKDVLAAIESLLASKREGAELDRGPRIPVLSEFIENEMTRFPDFGFDESFARDVVPLNRLFRKWVLSRHS
jgi:uncharacterized protein